MEVDILGIGMECTPVKVIIENNFVEITPKRVWRLNNLVAIGIVYYNGKKYKITIRDPLYNPCP